MFLSENEVDMITENYMIDFIYINLYFKYQKNYLKFSYDNVIKIFFINYSIINEIKKYINNKF